MYGTYLLFSHYRRGTNGRDPHAGREHPLRPLGLGVAVFGAIFNNRLAANLPKYLPPSALRAVHGSNISASPAQLDALPPAIHHGYVLAFSDSLHAVFLIGAPIALLAFALTWFLKDLPLRGHAYLAADDVMPRGNAPDTPLGAAKL